MRNNPWMNRKWRWFSFTCAMIATTAGIFALWTNNNTPGPHAEYIALTTIPLGVIELIIFRPWKRRK